MTDAFDPTESEPTAVSDVRRALEHANRAYGALLEFHHEIGRTMERLEESADALEAAGYDEFADEIREHHLSAGVVEDRWSYEVVADFETGFLADVDDFEGCVREELADGERYVAARRLKRHRRDEDGE